MYAVRGRPDVRSSGFCEKVPLRAFVVYAFLRLAAVGGALTVWPWLDAPLRAAGLHDGRWDWLALCVPVFLLGREAVGLTGAWPRATRTTRASARSTPP